MDDPNLTMEEYIRLEEEKACRRAIVFNDTLTSEATLSCEPTVSSLNENEIDFRISFDESDDEDYTNEFPAIVYNDAQKSKPDLFTEPILNLQCIDEFNLNDKTSLSEYDEEEQNVLYFNDLFPFNIVCSDDSKAEKHDDSNDIDIIQPFEDNENTHGSTKLFGTSHDKNTKDFRTGSFVINLIVIWIYYANGMLFYLIKNLCAPFGVPFDPKRYYKDGVCAIMLQRPRYDTLTTA
ncbi:hypothetical protein Tco_0469225 [Tanacetum coccineum]